MNTAPVIRYCISCPEDRPTRLSEYNRSDKCYACQEREFRESLLPKPPKPKKPEKKKLPKGACVNCERTGLALHKKKDGENLCSTCKAAANGLTGELREQVLKEIAAHLKGKGRLGSGPRPGKARNGRGKA